MSENDEDSPGIAPTPSLAYAEPGEQRRVAERLGGGRDPRALS